MRKQNISGIVVLIILVAATIAIVAYTLSNGTAPVGPPTPVANQPTPTPNVISPFIDRAGTNRWGIPGWSVNSLTNTPALTSDVMYLFPVRIQYNQTWSSVAVGVNTAAVNGIVRVCTYLAQLPPYDSDGLRVSTLLHDFGTVAAATTGTKTIVDTVSPIITDSAGFYFMAVVTRGDTGLVMRSPNPFDMLQSPVSAITTGAGGPIRAFALNTDADTDFIDVGCPQDGTSIVTGVVSSSGYPAVWVLQNS